MSRYTTQLRWIVEQLSTGLEPPEGQEYPNAVYNYIGLSSYPIFDSDYRTKLNDKIIDHFYFQEIGFETPAQFAWMMKRTMNEIMPKYNALYEAQQDMDAHPLADYWRHIDETVTRDDTDVKTYDVDNTDTRKTETTYGKHIDRDDTTTTTIADDNEVIFSDTPMSMLSNSGSPSVSGLDYATSVTYENNDTSNTTVLDGATVESGKDTSQRSGALSKDGTVTDTRDRSTERDFTEYGRNRNQAWLLHEFEQNYVNIDMLILNDLEELFMGVW